MKIEVNFTCDKSSTCGNISWERLAKQLEKSGELLSGESITRIEADGDGIRYFVRKDGNSNLEKHNG